VGVSWISGQIYGFQAGFEGFQANARDFTSDFKDFRDLTVDFKVIKLRSNYTGRDFRLDFGDFRSDFRTFVHRISEVVGPSPEKYFRKSYMECWARRKNNMEIHIWME